MGKADSVMTLGLLGGLGVGAYLLFSNLPNIQKAISDFLGGIGKGAGDVSGALGGGAGFVINTFDPRNLPGNIEKGADIYYNLILNQDKDKGAGSNTSKLTIGNPIIPDALSNPGWISNAPNQMALVRQTFSANPPTPQQTVAVSLGLPISAINPAVNTGTSNPIKTFSQSVAQTISTSGKLTIVPKAQISPKISVSPYRAGVRL